MKLLELFPSAAIYDEALTDAEYPHFFIYVAGMGIEEDNFGRRFLNFLVDITYRETERPEMESDAQNKLDGVGLEMLEKFESFEREGEIFRVRDARAEKADGALHFLFSVRRRVRKASPHVDKQMILYEKSDMTQ
jgi:hypothetical protein